MLVKFGLGHMDRFLKVTVGQGRVENLVAMLLEEGGLFSARSAVPAVEDIFVVG